MFFSLGRIICWIKYFPEASTSTRVPFIMVIVLLDSNLKCVKLEPSHERRMFFFLCWKVALNISREVFDGIKY